MKKAMLKPVEWLGDLGCKAHIGVSTRCADYVESRTPRERRIMMASAAMTFTGLFVATAAHAQSNGIAAMFDTAAQQGDSIKTNLASSSPPLGSAVRATAATTGGARARKASIARSRAGRSSFRSWLVLRSARPAS